MTAEGAEAQTKQRNHNKNAPGITGRAVLLSRDYDNNLTPPNI